MRKGSGSFGGLRMLGSERKSAHSPGRARIKNITLSRSGVDNYRRRGEERLRNGENHEHRDAPNFPEMINVDDFLTGAKQADLSHAGGELGSLEEDIEEDLVVEDHRRGSKREDWRTHRDRTEIRNRAFAQPDARHSVGVYTHVRRTRNAIVAPLENARMDEVYEIQVVDMFRQGYSASLAFGSTGAMCPLEANGSNQGRTVGWFQFKPQGSRGSNQFKQWFKQATSMGLNLVDGGRYGAPIGWAFSQLPRHQSTPKKRRKEDYWQGFEGSNEAVEITSLWCSRLRPETIWALMLLRNQLRLKRKGLEDPLQAVQEVQIHVLYPCSSLFHSLRPYTVVITVRGPGSILTVTVTGVRTRKNP
ncbi:hypothetical protein B0H14DRAFT_2646346 [Mycena olivaceomarginata]|nr:hypothetical protein B0H14DRAFT_2646346 [Mycena olivaceomarginata]